MVRPPGEPHVASSGRLVDPRLLGVRRAREGEQACEARAATERRPPDRQRDGQVQAETAVRAGVRGTWRAERKVIRAGGAVKLKRVIVTPELGIFQPHGPNLQGPRVVDLNINGFQHAWFNLLAANLGYRGLSKWDAFFGKYDI